MRNVPKGEALTFNDIVETYERVHGKKVEPLGEDREVVIEIAQCPLCFSTNVAIRFSVERRMVFIDCEECPAWSSLDLVPDALQEN